MAGGARDGALAAALPFALIAISGAAVGGYGLASQFGIIQSGETIESELAVYLPPFLILLGVLLFVSMAYYFVRTLLSGD